MVSEDPVNQFGQLPSGHGCLRGIGDTRLFSASGDGTPLPGACSRGPAPRPSPSAARCRWTTCTTPRGMLLAANTDTSRVRWVMTSREFVAIRKLKDGDDRYQVTPDPTEPALTGCSATPSWSPTGPGHRAGTPTGRDALVDFSQAAVARDVAPLVKILDQLYGD